VQHLKPLADQAGLTMAQLAVAWVLQHDFISSAIVGASRPEQVLDNAAASGITLGADLMAEIDTVLAGVYLSDPRLTVSPETRP
jgi:aryl-alcohol dehydrogenase-like predicted oxidoreductase